MPDFYRAGWIRFISVGKKPSESALFVINIRINFCVNTIAEINPSIRFAECETTIKQNGPDENSIQPDGNPDSYACVHNPNLFLEEIPKLKQQIPNNHQFSKSQSQNRLPPFIFVDWNIRIWNLFVICNFGIGISSYLLTGATAPPLPYWVESCAAALPSSDFGPTA